MLVLTDALLCIREMLYSKELPAVGLSDGLGVGDVTTKSMGPLPVGREVEPLLHLQNFFLGKHFSAGLSSGLSGVGTGPNVTSTSTVDALSSP